MLKRNASLIILLFLFESIYLFGQTPDVLKFFPSLTASAQKIVTTSFAEKTIDKTLEKIQKYIETSKTQSDNCYLNILAAQINEQLGNYSEAQRLYSVVSSVISGKKETDADYASFKNLPSSSELTLNASRCALSRGDFMTAELLLSSINKKIATPEITAKIKLYTCWAWLCKVEDTESLHEPIVILKSYLEMPSMVSVKPAILLTLWHITNEKPYSDTLLKEYPKSPESAVVNNKAELMPAPFWYFIKMFN